MALIKCKECKHEISKKAKTCPSCGAKNKAKTSVLAWLVLGFIVLAVIGGMGNGDRSSSSSSSKNAVKQKPTIVPVFERVDTEINSLKKRATYNYKDASVSEIIIHLGIGARARLLEEAKEAAKTQVQKDKVNQLFDQVSKLQEAEFPKIRDAYGPALRKKLWENDATAKTVGKGFRTIRLQAGFFAANRNIKATQESVSDTLHQLRFKRAEYRWRDNQDEYTYYDLKSVYDSEVVNWVSESRYREIVKY